VNHETEFVRNFIVFAKRDRYLSLLESRKGRRKLLDGLNHPRDLDGRRRSHLMPSAQTIGQIEALLKKKDAPERCYVISSSQNMDGLEMSLREALDQTVGQGRGTVISCIPGKLAYFEGEEPNERYLLERKDE